MAVQRNGKQSFSKNDQAGVEEMARQLTALTALGGCWSPVPPWWLKTIPHSRGISCPFLNSEGSRCAHGAHIDVSKTPIHIQFLKNSF